MEVDPGKLSQYHKENFYYVRENASLLLDKFLKILK